MSQTQKYIERRERGEFKKSPEQRKQSQTELYTAKRGKKAETAKKERN